MRILGEVILQDYNDQNEYADEEYAGVVTAGRLR